MTYRIDIGNSPHLIQQQKNMDFNEYQFCATSTAIYPGKNEILGLAYAVLGLTGESGEVAEKLKKIIRDKGTAITDEDRLSLQKELGDVLWYVSAIATELRLDLSDVAQINLDKLSSRKQRSALDGSGDDR